MQLIFQQNEAKAKFEKEHPEAVKKRQTQTYEEVEKELMEHPFFLKELPKEGDPLPPLLEAFQQLKYSETDNSAADLLENYKQDGLFHFKLKKWRTSAMCFTEGLKYAEDSWEKAKLYNNRAACQFHLENFGSSLRDCEKALQYDKTYAKALIRALSCCSKLSKWDQLIKLHKQYARSVEATKEQKAEIDKLHMQAVRNSKFEAAQLRKSTLVQKLQDENDEKIIKAVEARGIRMKSKKFLRRDREASSDHRVQITTDGELIWPVLIFYPHLAESDLIKEFYEGATFQEELVELLEMNPPAWDSDKEFVIDNISVYFTDLDTGNYVKVDLLTKLKDALKHKKYILPENGVPAFFVMANGNPMCEMILSRMEDKQFEWKQ
ncbi:unnamed protein product [Allacma fusca]|uniref:Cns1/TTC4 wheel domain-containing protein n=1 Tax=Allacma fusca TaxID=39272 RepID=A0A8J2L8I1_9HEXA|nr:unnamed protein product [Allacma fusca]